MAYKNIQTITAQQVIDPYLLKKTSYEVAKELGKKFKKSSKQIASLVAEEIVKTYDIEIIHTIEVANEPARIAINFRPKRRYWHKK